MTKQIKTIDITPKWEALILPMLQAFVDTDNMEVRRDIINQLTKIARIADNVKEQMDKLDRIKEAIND